MIFTVPEQQTGWVKMGVLQESADTDFFHSACSVESYENTENSELLLALEIQYI